MPLIAQAVAAYACGLLAGFMADVRSVPWLIAGGAAFAVAAAIANRRGPAVIVLVASVGVAVAATQGAAPLAPDGILESWRIAAGVTIDRLFGEDAPIVRALLIADTRELPAGLRDLYARAGMVHVLSISGLHVGIIAGAVLVVLRAARLPVAAARWSAAAITALYVAAIGAPPPAVRSASMFGAVTLGWALQRPVSPWATLAVGSLVPLLVDPATVMDLGYQLSVAGFASLTAATTWSRRALPPALRGWRRTLARDLAVSALATLATAPLVAWHFGRVSLVAPLSNIVAGPIVAVMQPALFLALVVAPVRGVAPVVAAGASLLVRALNGVAAAFAAVPGASVAVAPSLVTAALLGVAALAIVAAAASRRRAWQGGVLAAAAVVAAIWLPALPTPERGMELHVIDVGQGDAIAIRTPKGRWIVMDAGGGRQNGDAGRKVVIPYLRRRGGDVAMLILSHPHDDHVGGAPALVATLHPAELVDAAFAGTSASYRATLLEARGRGVPWRRIHPGATDSVDGVQVEFLAPDSAWMSSLHDANLASAVVRVQFGRVRLLLTGDAEAPEEAWLLEHAGARLRADVLKVAHHGSGTSSSSAFLDAVAPAVTVVSVGRHNRYGHPSAGVMDALAARGAIVLRTDERGSIVLHTDVRGDSLYAGDRAVALSPPRDP